ncbi:MAG: [protein-PII] uridylyltransferase [Dichotomicrobium sp.]
MEQRVVPLAPEARPTAPYFDPQAARAELTALWRRYGDGPSLRPKALEVMKGLVRSARDIARAELEATGDGRACAENLSLFQDELIRLIYDFVASHIYRAKNPSAAERMTLIATGGYGRGMLAPKSDIDLLFLRPSRQTAWGESVVESILYFLWDLGFKVGHATRTINDCVTLARRDMTIRTSLLDARPILGDAALFERFREKFRLAVIAGTEKEFIAAKLAERDARHERSGNSRYRVEPDVKDGKGGLRDLHTLHWLTKYLYPDSDGEDWVALGIFSPTEQRNYRRCEDFLWSIRCHLHFLVGKPEERLSFDRQLVLAERLGYRESRNLRPVERFMKHYFLVAKEVGDLTRIVCASLEMQQVIATPRLGNMLAGLDWRRRSKLSATTDFRIENGRLTTKRADVFRTDPVNMIRVFALAEEHKVLFDPEVFRLMRASLPLIDDDVRANPEANRLFLQLLTSRRNPEIALRRMNEAGVLGRFIPAFGRVVAMMQFNMYHHFTVDEHLIRTIGVLSEIEDGDLADELPLSTEIIRNIQNRRALFVAAFLHDIAKGREEDHSIAGARVARDLCPRLGLTPAETETVAWLIEKHLVMSEFAQSRDTADPKTIRHFAEIVQSPERLKLLVILTVADIRAVGPGVWTGWKGQLLRGLYYETEPVLAGGHTQISREAQIRCAQDQLREVLSGWPAKEVEDIIDRHYPAYWLRCDLDTQKKHAELMRRCADDPTPFAHEAQTAPRMGATEITLFTKDHPRLLAIFAGACAAAGARIVGAHIYTTRDGMALDTLGIQRAFPEDSEELERAERIAGAVQAMLSGERDLKKLMAEKRKSKPKLEPFSVEPQVIIDNTLSNELTVIEVNGLDRIGLLYDLADALASLNLNIASAHVATFGEKVVDVFYVMDRAGKKIESDWARQRVHEKLIEVLAR